MHALVIAMVGVHLHAPTTTEMGRRRLETNTSHRQRIAFSPTKGSTIMAMTRDQVYAEMTQMFGLVPSFFKLVPDNSLELEWKLFKTVQFDEGPIPNKYRELIGIGISAITKCEYCILYHTEVAKLNGATEAEIEDAVHYAKS